MTDPRDTPACEARDRQSQAALKGAGLVMLLIWAAIIGVYVSNRDWNEAIFWSAIAVATSAGVFGSIFAARRKS